MLFGSLVYNSVLGSEFSSQFRNGDTKLPKPWQDMKTNSFPSVVGEGLIPAISIFLAYHK